MKYEMRHIKELVGEPYRLTTKDKAINKKEFCLQNSRTPIIIGRRGTVIQGVIDYNLARYLKVSWLKVGVKE